MTPEEKIERAWQLLSEAMKGQPLSDRLAHLSWLLLLKYIDDYDATRKSASEQDGTPYRPILESNYCWSTWVSKALSTSHVDGKKLIEFLRDDLFIYLASLRTIPPKLEIHVTLYSIFEWEEIPICDGTNVLREILFLINDINFYDMDHRSAIASLYKGYVQDMEISTTSARDFFTPREVMGVMLKMLQPQQHQTFLDPSCGTGAFLLEAYKYIETLYGQQASQSLLLFGRALNSLDALISTINVASIGKPIEHIYHSDVLQGYPDHFPKGFGCVLANPPFGIIKDDRTRKNPFLSTFYYEPLLLHRCIDGISSNGGISSVIVSITALTRDIAAFVDMRERLLTECDLSMVIILPPGVFAPRTDVRASILFLRKPGPTRETFYYKVHPIEEGSRPEHLSLSQCLAQALTASEKWQQYRISGKERPESNENSWIEIFNDKKFRNNRYRLGTHDPAAPIEDSPAPEIFIDMLLELNRRFYHAADSSLVPAELTNRLLNHSQEFRQQLSALRKHIGEEVF